MRETEMPTPERKLRPGIGDLCVDWSRKALERGIEKAERFTTEARDRQEYIAAEMIQVLRFDMEHGLEELNKVLVE